MTAIQAIKSRQIIAFQAAAAFRDGEFRLDQLGPKGDAPLSIHLEFLDFLETRIHRATEDAGMESFAEDDPDADFIDSEPWDGFRDDAEADADWLDHVYGDGDACPAGELEW
jgi:hypothetical protein